MSLRRRPRPGATFHWGSGRENREYSVDEQNPNTTETMSRWEMYTLSLGLAAITAMSSKLDDFNYDEVINWTSAGWAKAILFTLAQVMIAWKSLSTTMPPKDLPANPTPVGTLGMPQPTKPTP